VDESGKGKRKRKGPVGPEWAETGRKAKKRAVWERKWAGGPGRKRNGEKEEKGEKKRKRGFSLPRKIDKFVENRRKAQKILEKF